MKKQTILYGLLLMLLAAACSKGPQGDIGPVGAKGAIGDAGLKGTTGDTGVKGTTGDTGNSNVIYTEWRSPDFKEPITSPLLNRKQFEPIDMPFPLLTQDVLNTSQIFIYVKHRRREGLIATGLKLVEYIQEASTPISESYYLFPGRSGSTTVDYGTHSVAISPVTRPNVISIGTHVMITAPGGANTSTTVNITPPEMFNKTPAFYRDLMKDLVKYRVVIVKGNIAGRLAAIDWKNYAEVKAALNLKD
jgi:Collagen triple helix repeat (20 copies)